MRRRAGHRRWVVAIGLAMVGVVGAVAPAAAAAWRVVPSPNTNPYKNFLAATARVPGTSQFWAVGYTLDGPALGTNHSLIEHTYGSRWSVVPSPDPNGESHLAGVAASSPSAAWAAGWTTDGALIDRWNGTRWSRVALPAAARGATLFGVRAFSATDVLAVGAIGTATGEQPVSLHWNGSAWSLQRAPVPRGCTDASFWAVAAQPGSSVRWAVGDCPSSEKPLIERWNGSRWSIVASPSVFAGALYDVTPVGPNDMWAVGYRAASPGILRRTLTEHWNGARWSIVPSPNETATDSDGLGSVIRVPGTRVVWAVGSSLAGPAVALRWDGRTWQSVPPVSVGQDGVGLSGVAAASPANVVAVGFYVPVQGPPIYATLIERYADGSA